MNLSEEKFENIILIINERFKEQGDDGIELAGQMEKSFRKYWDNPPCDHLKMLLNIDLDEDKVRYLLFFPGDDLSMNLIQYWPNLIKNPPEDSEDDHPQKKVQIISLALFYLVHVHEWNKFTKYFIMLPNGLKNLVELFSQENLYIRGQALECFMHITSVTKEDTNFDWFQPLQNNIDVNQIENDNETKDDNNNIVHNQESILLHTRLLELDHNSSFFPGLFLNRKNSFPGGSLISLQILAFWLSWKRAIHCENQRLKLKSNVLEEIRLWKQGSPDSDLQREEELKFAEQLYNDFNERSIIDDSIDEETTKTNRSNLQNETKFEKSWMPLKEKGKEYFLEKQYGKAIKLYIECLNIGENATIVPMSNEIKANLYCNLATCLYKYWLEEDKTQSVKDILNTNLNVDPENKNDILEKSIYYCQESIKLNENYFKPYFRLGQINELKNDYIFARETLQEGLIKTKDSITDVERKAGESLLAHVLLCISNDNNSESTELNGLDENTEQRILKINKILHKLNTRQGRPRSFLPGDNINENDVILIEETNTITENKNNLNNSTKMIDLNDIDLDDLDHEDENNNKTISYKTLNKIISGNGDIVKKKRKDKKNTKSKKKKKDVIYTKIRKMIKLDDLDGLANYITSKSSFDKTLSALDDKINEEILEGLLNVSLRIKINNENYKQDLSSFFNALTNIKGIKLAIFSLNEEILRDCTELFREIDEYNNDNNVNNVSLCDFFS